MNLCAQLQPLLGDDFKYYKSKQLFSRENGEGEDVVQVSVTCDAYPQGCVYFYFGRRFHKIKKLEKQNGYRATQYHIHQHSNSIKNMHGLTYDGSGFWHLNLEDTTLPFLNDFHDTIVLAAYPFFKRFRELESAREALLTEDSWCFPAFKTSFHQLVKFDICTGNVDNIQNWQNKLDDAKKQIVHSMVNMHKSKQDNKK